MTRCNLCGNDAPCYIAFTDHSWVTDSYCGACWITLRRVFGGINAMVRFVGLVEDAP